MRSFFRWSLVLGVLGSLAWGVKPTPPAMALPEQEVIQKLSLVPVFTIADERGAPLIASSQEGDSRAGAFFSRQDAEEFVAQLQQRQPELAQRVRVVPVSLGQIYQLDRQRENQADDVDFTYVPAEEQVQLARTLLEQQGQDADRFQGVPLFIARIGENQSYLTVERNGQQAIPFFFEKEQVQQLLERYRQQQPDQAQNVQIDVTTLQSVISALQSGNEEELKQIELIPSREGMEVLRSLQRQQQN